MFGRAGEAALLIDAAAAAPAAPRRNSRLRMNDLSGPALVTPGKLHNRRSLAQSPGISTRCAARDADSRPGVCVENTRFDPFIQILSCVTHWH